jgi:hypothetical protein
MLIYYVKDNHLHRYCYLLFIVLKSSLAWRVDSGLESGRVEEKTGEGKTRCNPATWPKTRLQPVDFFFLLKRHRFDFKKKLTRATRSKPGSWTGPGLKTMLLLFLFFFHIIEYDIDSSLFYDIILCLSCH